MRLSIDMDQSIYACGFAAEGEPINHALKLMKNKVEQIFRDCETENYTMYVAGEGNFRDDVDFDYKATRTSRKPSAYKELKEYLINVWGAIPCDGIEADDAVSMDLWADYVAYYGEKSECQTILVSPDKDLNNTPGWHYNPRTREKYWVSDKQAHRHFWYQMLMGDAVDNIKGLPYCGAFTIHEHRLRKSSASRGCGKVSAKKIMEHPNYIAAVYEAYCEWGQIEGMSRDETFDYMQTQGRLLWMLRELDEFGDPVMFELDGVLFDDCWNTTKNKGTEGSESKADSDVPEQEERISTEEETP